MQKNDIKIIVAHPGRQHSFRLATALKEAGILYKYATTVYDKESSILMRFVKKVLNKNNLSRAEKRKCLSIPDDDVIQFCELGGLINLLLIRLDKSHRISNWHARLVSRIFQRKLAKYIIREGVEMVISYDTNSSYLFSLLSEKAPQVIRVMDNAHPNRHYLHFDYQRNWGCCGEFSETLKACGYLTNDAASQRYGEEIRMANYHIVASSYSEQALLFEGVSHDRIFKVPYGVDSSKFIAPVRQYEKNKLNVLFLGEVNQRKGIRQVLEAARIINSPDIVFNIVGAGANHCSNLYDPYRQYVNFLGFVSYEELLKQLKESHVFLFPTMGEGFGLVLLEAMASGLPVITTRNCGGADLVKEKYNGFLVSVGSSEEIVDVLNWCRNNPHELETMSLRARETAETYTWGRYNKGVVDCISDILSR